VLRSTQNHNSLKTEIKCYLEKIWLGSWERSILWPVFDFLIRFDQLWPFKCPLGEWHVASPSLSQIRVSASSFGYREVQWRLPWWLLRREGWWLTDCCCSLARRMEGSYHGCWCGKKSELWWRRPPVQICEDGWMCCRCRCASQIWFDHVLVHVETLTGCHSGAAVSHFPASCRYAVDEYVFLPSFNV